MPKLQETARISEAAAAEVKKTGRMIVQHISPGWGSSGHYSAQVLEQAVVNQVIPAGTHMYADHPTEAEDRARPIRSIKDLMSVTVEDARIATDADVARGADVGGLVSEVDVIPTYRPLIEHLKDAIGVSIRGAGDVVIGEADGREGKIVQTLEHVQSVDWVTHAGRGGKVLSLVESAQANRRAVRHGLDEATVNDTREALQTVLRDAYPSDEGSDRGHWVWVRDFDDTTVWFEIEGGDDAGVFGQTYTSGDDGAVALSGDRTEVRVVTNYVPVARPGSTTQTQESEEDAMPKIEVEEAEHNRLVETAGRVTTLEQERDTEKARADVAEEAIAERDRTDRAHEIVEARAKEANVEFTPLEVKGLLADLPLKEDGSLDEEKLTTAVDTDAAAIKEAATAATGAGTVIGFGSRPGTAVTESAKPTKNAWGRDLTEKGA